MSWIEANYFPSHTVFVTALCNGRWRYRSPVPVHLARLHRQLGISCADAACFEGCCSDPASIQNVCVRAHSCSIAELWTDEYFLCICVCVCVCQFFLSPWEGKYVLGYKSFWMLTAWRRAMKMLDFASLPCVLSPTHVFIAKTGDSWRLYK